MVAALTKIAMRTIWFLWVVVVALAIRWLSRDNHSPLYIPTSLDLLTLTTHDIADLLGNNTINSLQITKEYLRRIELDDRSGLGLHTILELTPVKSIISIANERDLERRKGLIRSPLHGVPLIVKVNFNPLVQNTNVIDVASARAIWPQISLLFKHPCGSSAGSVAAVAAGFAPLALGTETQGSISCPASFTALYGLKVSTGVLSRSGILSSSTTFDSPGILAKSAWDIAALLTEIDGVDDRDPITFESEGLLVNYTNSLDASWADFRIGVADKEWFWSILPGFMFSAGFDVVREIERRGATIVADAKIRSAYLSTGYVAKLMGRIIRYEMGPGFAQHVMGLEGTETKSLADRLEFNRKFPASSYSDETPAQNYLELALDQKMTLEEYQDALLEARKIAIEEGIIETLDSYNLDASFFPLGRI
ncbi:amidase family protein [Penicillium psychrosexuale]|uniref:amidase family protein n=1 Tax=Penicillium psychrosexuale TaxID=1002107 RepID=UPI0025450DA8|nr:amidase family protein [Penicillium psychrosexuale]KAJ5799445.1 amidase family protein [Penicillium psychrosexuale]